MWDTNIYVKQLRNLPKVKDQGSGRDGLKPGLPSFKFCVFHIKIATDSGMELHGVSLESEESGWTDDRGRGRHDVRARESKEPKKFQDKGSWE